MAVVGDVDQVHSSHRLLRRVREHGRDRGAFLERVFVDHHPREVAKQHEALLLAMKLGAILYEWRFGKDEGCLPSLTLRLRAELECTIPSLPDVEAALES